MGEPKDQSSLAPALQEPDDAYAKAFAAGNFAEIQRLAAADPQSDRAKEMKARLAVDPLMTLITVGCLLLFLGVAFFVR